MTFRGSSLDDSDLEQACFRRYKSAVESGPPENATPMKYFILQISRKETGTKRLYLSYQATSLLVYNIVGNERTLQVKLDQGLFRSERKLRRFFCDNRVSVKHM